ncbi:MAG: hypothetical protein N5P05_002049 [Chroococcopsis gigantea SAG 12.99]|jgi:hypothetical protein|nr:hypothetical protein [Chlorogloea purpurea SAG 13.99]MDV3000443.1 hypothetical protein [Chroococcopsis gigantea SAG 12.99]
MSLTRCLVLSSLLSLLAVDLAAKAETCIPLSLVGGQGDKVTKTVSQPTIKSPLGGIDITRNNWNTDWAVPGDRSFHRFIATVSSPKGGSFDIKMFLKYSDQTTGEFFNTDGVSIQPDKPLILKADNRPDDVPYQVNLFIGGLNHMGNTYTASVVGCYR